MPIIYIYAQAIPRSVDPKILAAAERQLAALPLETIPDPTPLPPGSRMPLRRNPLFVGREADLRVLATALKGGETTVVCQTAAASGVGGIGKTQLASEFVHRYGQFFAGGVCWLSCADPAAMPMEVAACGGPGVMALHPEFHTLPITDQVQLVQAAWQNPLPRLLVFDNCEDEALLAQWRPPHGGCRVLVTSRRVQWEATLGVQALPLGVLRRGESVTLLHHHRPDLPANDADLDAIAAELGDLPLALHLAGSFLARYRQTVTPAVYLIQLRQPDLLEYPSFHGGQLFRDISPTQHEQHVARTFALSYGRLDPADPIDACALALLARAAYFAPGQPIPQDLVVATLGLAAEDRNAALQAKGALGQLLDLALLEAEAASAVRIHRLLAVFVREVTHDTAVRTAVENVVLAEADRLINAGYPGPLLALHPHLQAVTEAAQPREEIQAARLDTALGHALQIIGDYAGAQPFYERALALFERALGPNHPNTATSVNDLAALYQAQGRYDAAEPLLQRALALSEQALGPDHPNTATSLTNLALLYQAQGRSAEAESLYQRALAISERALGPDHPDTATSLNNLAGLYEAQGRYGEAEPLYQRALVIHEQALGPDHPDTATSLNNLAGLYDTQGRYGEAEPLYQRALAIVERVLGPDHPDVEVVRHNYFGVLATVDRKPPLRGPAHSIFPQLNSMGTAQNFVTAQFATVWEGSKSTFTVKTGLKCVVIRPSRSPAGRPAV